MIERGSHCVLDIEKPGEEEIPSSPELDFGDQITVEAWVTSDSWRSEALAALVSKWKPADSFGPFDAFDAGNTDGLNSTGYFGAVFDGRYVYFSPEQHNSLEQHAVVLRYDTHRGWRPGRREGGHGEDPEKPDPRGHRADTGRSRPFPRECAAGADLGYRSWWRVDRGGGPGF